MLSPSPQSTCGLVGQTPMNPQAFCGGYRVPRANQARSDSFFSFTASLTSGVHHRVQALPPSHMPLETLWPQLQTAVPTMEVENMLHLDSMSLASLGIWSLVSHLFQRWELKTSLTETFPADPHNAFKTYLFVQAFA